ncbi:MAG TPA: class I SAM-dependent methyltransferase [Bacteroidota bacterium]|nr:class I SAM-dependent methyltransferase [Bacteroidota bacterium]
MTEENPELEQQVDQLLAGRNPRRVLEAGCGSASHLRFPEGTLLCGIDISQKQLDKNEHMHEKIVGDLQTYPLPENTYDMVVCWDVLEHLPEPTKALENFFRTVNEGGIVIMASPNVFTLRGLITKLSPQWFHVFYARYIAGYDWAGQEEGYPFVTFHRWAIAPKAIERLAQSRNMKVISSDTFGFDHPEKRHAIFYALWSAVDKLANIISFGKLETDAAAAFCIILQKRSRIIT